jgi:SAM-dependent methyltransferase
MAGLARHVFAVLLVRSYRILFDARQQSGLPQSSAGQVDIDRFDLRTVRAEERWAAAQCSPTPVKTFDWAIKGLPFPPDGFRFVDIGAGTGYAMALAARYPFRSIEGIEFAPELHERACANIDWIKKNRRLACADLRATCASALEAPLPRDALLVYMFAPFDEPVMTAFVDRLAAEARRNPRPVVVVYVNPLCAPAFRRPEVREIRLALPYRWLLAALSPFAVRVYAFGSEAERATSLTSPHCQQRTLPPPNAAVSKNAALEFPPARHAVQPGSCRD